MTGVWPGAKEVAMSSRAVLAGIVMALIAGGVLAQVPEDERIRITDPVRLRAMGFPADATNVYVWSRADRKGGRIEDAGSLRTREAETWGTQVGFTPVSPNRLDVPWPDDIRVFKNMLSASCLENASFDNVFDVSAEAQFEVPDGARLDQFLFWALDTNDDHDLGIQVYETCQLEGANPPTYTLIGEGTTVLAIGQYFGFGSLNGLTVDNKHCHYSVNVVFTPAGEECAPGLAFEKFRVNWIRQVSPVPSQASFTDVPTGHPFFQYVEALVKSGVTGGCGGGNYCPDAPLTRGQMAVFLAKALGLQWP